MVKICPSTLCNHENPDSNNYCEKCGIDLSQDEQEVKGRDILFGVFKSLGSETTILKEEEKKLFEQLDRKMFDHIIEKNVGKIFLITRGAISENIKELEELKQKQSKEINHLELEKEKLKTLKEISKNLNKSKRYERRTEFPKRGLYSLFLDRLEELKPNSSGIIKFPEVFEELCTSFQINKKQCWEIIFMFRDFKLIEIIKGQGIKIVK
jgi:hypothetical protein